MPNAQWDVWTYCSAQVSGVNQRTPTTLANWRKSVSTASVNLCFSMGGGTYRDGLGPLNAIQINTYNSTMHVVSSAASNCVDKCSASGYHMIALRRAASTAGKFYCADSAAALQTRVGQYYDQVGFSTPSRTAGVQFRFRYGSQLTQVTQCQIWGGRDAGVTGVTPGGTIYMMELATTKAGNDWNGALTGSRLSLTSNGHCDVGRCLSTLSTGLHMWYVGMCVYATAVGLSTAGRVRIENTFQ